MRSRSINEVEKEMSFSLYAPKEYNELKEDDKRFFLENMRSRSINEAEDEKLKVLKRKKKAFLSQSTILFCFLTDELHLQIGGLFWPL